MNLAALWFPSGPTGTILVIVALIAIGVGIYMGRRAR